MAVCGLADDYTTQSKNAQHDFKMFSDTPLNVYSRALLTSSVFHSDKATHYSHNTTPLSAPGW